MGSGGVRDEFAGGVDLADADADADAEGIEGAAAVPVALTAPLLEAPTYDPLDLEHVLTVHNLAQNDAFLDADEDAFVGMGDGAGRRRRSCGP